MDVLFINPNRMQPPVAPLAIDYLGQALVAHGISCRVADLCLEHPCSDGIPSSFWQGLVEPKPSAVLISLRNLDDAYYTSQETFLPGYRELVTRIHEVLSVPVILGGCGFSMEPERILTWVGADYGIAGASEMDLLGLLDALGQPAHIARLPGVTWREGNEARSNPPSPPEMRTDFFSSRSVVRNEEYFVKGGMVGLETKRGCTGICRYCADPVGKGRRIFTKPMDFLLGEIRSLVRRGITVFHLCDSEFNLPREHAVELCDAVRQEGLGGKVKWFTYATPEGFDETLALRMAEAGCAGINFGVDHCREDMLVSLGRRHSARDLEQSCRAARRAGIPFLFDLLLGGPGETLQSAMDAVEFCRDQDVQRVGVNVGIRVYPGTSLAEEVLAQGPLRNNPNLKGVLEDNEYLLHPVFFVSAELGEDWQKELASRLEGDSRFFLPQGQGRTSNYNYNTNQVLVDALRKGHRGAFWDILRRLQEGLPPLEMPETCLRP